MPNRLHTETSPYLWQHRHQPIDWYPWGEEAWREARQQDKPVFISIGYSSCHWCHVMSREAFSDAGIAELLNTHFICIKVDREERPDIDQLYMEACRHMTGRGGWPLTVLTGPDQKPFFAGSYFPVAALRQILERALTAWKSNRASLTHYADQMTRFMQESERGFPMEPSLDVVDAAYHQLVDSFDAEHGGFSVAPKFPSPHLPMFLLRYARVRTISQAPEMVRVTLDSMARGGIYDQIGFGFFRYAVDEAWQVPHFEKLLDDNALLALAYLEAAAAEPENPFWERVACQVLDYMLYAMQSPDGAFYTTEDADSDGEEGGFYLWDFDQVIETLGEEAGPRLASMLGISPEGNFEGRNVPHLSRWPDSEEAQSFLETQRLLLQQARSWRQQPQRDEKILLAHNGLTMAALARAGAQCGEGRYLKEARRIARFISRDMTAEEGRLYSCFVQGKARLPAHAQDYAFLIWGLLELYQADSELAYLDWAYRLAGILASDFADPAEGGFFFASRQAEQLVVRLKAARDEAHPSANAVAAHALQRLGILLAQEGLLAQAAATRRAFTTQMVEAPAAYTWMLAAVLEADFQDRLVVVTPQAKEKAAVRDLLLREAPHVPLLLWDEEQELPAAIRPLLSPYASKQNQITAYLCSGKACYAPVLGLDALQELLRGEYGAKRENEGR